MAILNVWFEHLVERMTFVRSLEAANETLRELAVECGFGLFSYISLQAATKRMITNYAPSWVSRYDRKSYIFVDPVMRGLRKRTEAFRWVYAPERLQKQSATYCSDGARYGIRSGITVPINPGFGNVAMLTLAGDDPVLTESKILLPSIAAAAVGQMHSRLSLLGIPATPIVDVPITTKQLLCLHWHSEGKTGQDITVLTNETYGNVRYHLSGAKKALGATTLSQAVKIATNLRLI